MIIIVGIIVGIAILIAAAAILGAPQLRHITQLVKRRHALGRPGEIDIPESATISYMYWSDRRIRKVARDNGISLERKGDLTLKSPSIPMVPQVEWKQRDLELAYGDVASKIERGVLGGVLSDFSSPVVRRFAKGIGTVVFSEIPQGSGKMITAAAQVLVPGGVVAICMFGSFENLADVLTGGGVQEFGHSPSSYPQILKFLKTESVDPELGSDAGLAYAAAQIVFESGGTDEYPWRRGYTYGHLREVGEWFMEVYLDVAIAEPEVPVQYSSMRRFRRIIVGAPMWIRTPTLRALRVYKRSQVELLEKETRGGSGFWY